MDGDMWMGGGVGQGGRLTLDLARGFRCGCGAHAVLLYGRRAKRLLVPKSFKEPPSLCTWIHTQWGKAEAGHVWLRARERQWSRIFSRLVVLSCALLLRCCVAAVAAPMWRRVMSRYGTRRVVTEGEVEAGKKTRPQ